jgi:hypothetical protein
MKKRTFFTLASIIILATIISISGCSKSTSDSQSVQTTSTSDIGSDSNNTAVASAYAALKFDQQQNGSANYTSFNIPMGSFDFRFPDSYPHQSDPIEFAFSVTGGSVKYSILDPYGNIILIGNGGEDITSGAGYFIAMPPIGTVSGQYKLHFTSSTTTPPPVVTLYYLVY